MTALNFDVIAGPLAVLMGDLELGRRLLDDAGERAATSRDAQFTAPLMIGLAELALIEGRLDEAWALVSDGIARVLETDDAVLLTVSEFT